MTKPRRGNRALYTAPTHHCCVRGYTALEDFIPPDHASTVLRQIRPDLLHEPALHRVLRGDAESFHLRLNRRRGSPLVLDSLVPSQVDVLAGEQGKELVNDVFDERQAVAVGVVEANKKN